jgi:hypothetical protein
MYSMSQFNKFTDQEIVGWFKVIGAGLGRKNYSSISVAAIRKGWNHLMLELTFRTD